MTDFLSPAAIADAREIRAGEALEGMPHIATICGSPSIFLFSSPHPCYNPLPPTSEPDPKMPISQDRLKALLDAGDALRETLSALRAQAERALDDQTEKSVRALAILISESPIPDSIISTLSAEREHYRLTNKRNRTNAAEL